MTSKITSIIKIVRNMLQQRTEINNFHYKNGVGGEAPSSRPTIEKI